MVHLDPVSSNYQSPRPDEERVFNFRKATTRLHHQSSPNMSYTAYSTTASSSDLTTPHSVTSEKQIPSPIRIPKSTNAKNGIRKPPSPWDTTSPRSDASSSRRRRDPSPPAFSVHDEVHRETSESVEENELLVCDYETAATALYKLLETSQWEQALQRCRSHPLEVRTWVQRCADSSKPGQTIRWKVLPLHAAIVFKAPFTVIEALLQQHAKAAAARDDQGMLPLHLAFRHYTNDKEHERIIELLLDSYPKAVHLPDKRARTPLALAPDAAQFPVSLMRIYSSAAATKMRSDTPPMDATSIRKSATDPDALLDRSTIDYERRMEYLKQEHEVSIKTLVRQNQKTMVQVRLDAEEERQELMKRHHQEMDELRDLLSREVGREGQLSASLQVEVSKLRAQLEHSRKKQSALSTMMKGFQLYHDELHRHLREEVLVDQQRLLELVVQQQAELEAAQAMRNQLLRTILQHDEEDKDTQVQTHQTVVDLAERLKLRVETMANVSQQPLLLETLSTSVSTPAAATAAAASKSVMAKKVVIPTTTTENEARNDDDSDAHTDVSALTDHSF